ncbi:hypothetical protein BDY17DRAFT_66302 [Neohortaea acidophila]|uniref:Ketopantoate reductase N-terminal domain-containing protein n=1 Tax=Neohortaea acidophila TaxID=245834 RepID=A0A6A6PFP4_9PEZI|nr:uncharacterized protein BDY17DRAFT_66302 [Neohortaea acidophila]KAF2478473.1 hypothetical protein BDY17DRAFT_66302 [Neohortaea acidophila]
MFPKMQCLCSHVEWPFAIRWLRDFREPPTPYLHFRTDRACSRAGTYIIHRKLLMPYSQYNGLKDCTTADHNHASLPRVLTFGAGAVGTCYTCLLQQAGCQVSAVCRSNYHAAKREGFSLDAEFFGKNLQIRPDHLFRSHSDHRFAIREKCIFVTKSGSLRRTAAGEVRKGNVVSFLVC